MIFTLNFRDGGCQRNGIVAFLFVGKENTKWRCKERARDNDDGEHDEKRRATAQTGKGAYQLLDCLCIGFSQLFRGCDDCSGRAVVALFKHLSLCILRSCFSCAFCCGFRCRRFRCCLWCADLLCISRPDINAARGPFPRRGVWLRLLADGGRLLRWWLNRPRRG